MFALNDNRNKAMSDSIVTLNVGGKIFQTHISTLTKYPESVLGVMFNRVSQIIVLTSQTDEYLWDQTFSHYLGQKNYRNAKKLKFFSF